MGHVSNYTMGDVVSHFRRRNGALVLHPMGYDAFGLPAENAAIRTGMHPRDSTAANIAAIREQMRRMGWSIDWSRELSTASPDYYRWTQWIFLRLLERNLAYKKASVVNWCPKDQTVLANEQVIDGALRALRHGRRGEEPRAVVLPHHRLRRPAARRHGPARVVAGAGADDAAQLDRPLARRRGDLPGHGRRHGAPGLHDAPGHALRRDVLRARAGASARRAARPRHAAGGGGARLRRATRRSSPSPSAPRWSARRRASSPGAP